MPKSTQYQSRESDKNGFIAWSEEENQIWSELYARQISLVEERACQEYLDGLSLLKLSEDRIPQLPDINRILIEKTGWQLNQSLPEKENQVGSKRCDNSRLKATGFSFKYPSFKEGLAPLLTQSP